MEMAVNHILLVLNKHAFTEVKVILQLTKREKYPSEQAWKKTPKQIKE